MYFVYVLQSQIDKKFYTGYTRNLNERIKQHNNGVVSSTKDRRPLRLVYYSPCEMLHRSESSRMIIS